MSKNILIEKLKLCQKQNADPEIAHSLADEALLEFINDADVVTEYKKINKWYA